MKCHINTYLTPWIPFKCFWSSLIQPCLQNIYVSKLTNNLYTILRIRDMTVDTYSIFHFHWPKSVYNVSLGHISAECINMIISIVTTIFIARYASPFWCEVPAPLNLIFFWLFNSFSIKSGVLKIKLSVWYTLIIAPWLWSSRFKNTLYRIWRPSVELKNEQITWLDL